MNAKKLTGLALATAAAALFVSAGMTPAFAKEEAKVHCDGVNACKGQSACQSATNACHNAALEAASGNSGTLISSTSSVIATAKTPSLKASRRVVSFSFMATSLAKITN